MRSFPRLGGTGWRVVAAVLAASALAAGCNAIFGVDGYTVGDRDASADGASDVSNDSPASCENYDAASGMCFPCAPDPANQATFLNKCTSATCVPFDDKLRVPDYKGGPLPVVQIPVDSGSDGGVG